MSDQHIKVGGAWKAINNAQVKVSGAWKQVSKIYVKVGGAWKSVWTNLSVTALAVVLTSALVELLAQVVIQPTPLQLVALHPIHICGPSKAVLMAMPLASTVPPCRIPPGQQPGAMWILTTQKAGESL